MKASTVITTTGFSTSYNPPKPLSLNQYQTKARSTAIYSEKYRVTYPLHLLAGEVGELANKYQKCLRDQDGKISEALRTQMIGEMGDVLWALANLAFDLNVWLEDVAMENLTKLQSRMERGTISGSGDNR